MELFEEDELTDSELDTMLRTWESPAAPERIRHAVFPAREPWWRRGIRIPIPVAACLALLIASLASCRAKPQTIYRDRVTPVTIYRDRPTPVTVYRDRPTPVIVYRDRVTPVTIYRDRPTPVTVYRDRPADATELHPVTALEPRIVRNSDAQN